MYPDQVSRNKPVIRTDSTDNTRRTRPQNTPKSDKDFKKMVNDVDPDIESAEETAAAEESSLSVFDLSAVNIKKGSKKTANTAFNAPKTLAEGTEDPEVAESMQQTHMPQTPLPTTPAKNTPVEVPVSPFLPKDASEIGDSKKSVKNKNSSVDVAQEQDTSVALPTKERIKTPVRSSSGFSQEGNPDLSYVNPFAQPLTKTETDVATTEKQMITQRSIKEIMEQLVDGIQTIKTGEDTTTIVRLQYPPILEGAQVSLTMVKHAENAITIAFSDLSAQAKQFLDPKIDDLRKVMEQSGYVAEKITTTTNTININTESLGNRFARNQEKDEDNPRQQQRNKG